MDSTEYVEQKNNKQEKSINVINGFKFVFFSLLGLFLFFFPVTINGESAILIQHAVNWVEANLAPILPYYGLTLVLLGGLLPVISGKWLTSRFEFTFTLIKLLGCIIGVMAVFNFGPAFILDADMAPFLWNQIVMPILIIIPITIIGIVFLLNYGLLEFLSIFLRPVMRLIWKTPGNSALDAMVSFTGGYAIAVIVTNDLYKRGIYSAKEAVIIATGFSTVSIGFLLVIVDTLSLTQYWNAFFLSCLFVTFAVTAVTARIYPISKMPDTYYNVPASEETNEPGNIFIRAFKKGTRAAGESKSVFRNLLDGYKGDYIPLSTAVTASILSVGMAGLLLAHHTPVFDLIGYIFLPFTYILQIPEAYIAAKAVSLEIAEMFLPSLQVVDMSIITRFVVAVTSVSAVLFFSASIPALLSTNIPVKMRDVLIIWIERTILSLIFATIIAYLIF